MKKGNVCGKLVQEKKGQAVPKINLGGVSNEVEYTKSLYFPG